MRTVKCDTGIVFALALLLPAWVGATEESPTTAADIALSASSVLESAAEIDSVPGMGRAIDANRLADYQGGTNVNNLMHTDGTVNDTTAVNVMTGTNTISHGAFANASGIPVVIQNSGANVLIQNSMIVNVQFK